MSALRWVSSRSARSAEMTGVVSLRLAVLWAGLLVALPLAGSMLSPALAEAQSGVEKKEPTRLYASVFVSGRSGYRIIHYWSDQSKMRAETLIGGHPITTIVRDDQYLVFDRLTNKGLAITRAPAAKSDQAKRGRPFGNDWQEIRDAGGELVEETKLAGADVEVWQLTNSNGSQKVWVTKDAARVPLKVETYDRKSSNTVTQDYSNWTVELEMPAAFFEAAPNVNFERYSYEDFVAKARKEPVGTVPVLYPDLLHGSRPR